MIFHKAIASGCIAALLVLATSPVAARLTQAEADRLGKDLTPVGADPSGNKEGTIPPWTGGLTKAPPGWIRANGYADPFADEKPLFTITAQNADQYKAALTVGELALLKKLPTFRIPVYPSHRTAAYPKNVTDAAKAQATQVELKGFGVQNLGDSNIPFPIPKDGLEAVWNHLMRYTGGGTEGDANSFPVRANGEYYTIGVHATRIYDRNFDQHTPNRLFVARIFFTAPAELKGEVFLVHEPIDQVAEVRAAWIYNSGARRLRRAPDLAYDNINDGSEGMYTSDQVDGYNGAPDRYDWKLLGKREIYVPYNSYKMGDKKLKYKDMLLKGTINPDYTRYELHRVWVVDGTLKAGFSHVYRRRTFYLDEDSWTILLEDTYGNRGDLWRVGIHGQEQYYDVPGSGYRYGIIHDLDSGTYYAGGLDNEMKSVGTFEIKGRVSDYVPDAIRRLGGTTQ